MYLKLYSVLVLSLLFAQNSFANSFPKAPHPELTPGDLCDRPSEKRYPEGIPYCKRSVHSDLKKEIIERYDSEFGYSISKMNRQLFKIDHYIPLCMGGSNDPENLWPQHQSVYEVTDEIEHLACLKMKEGKLLQKDAVELIKKVKADLKIADEVTEELYSFDRTR